MLIVFDQTLDDDSCLCDLQTLKIKEVFDMGLKHLGKV